MQAEELSIGSIWQAFWFGRSKYISMAMAPTALLPFALIWPVAWGWSLSMDHYGAY
jgi:hypothetical protein